MNRTLEDTIKGLQLCITNEDNCNKCPYKEYNTEEDIEENCIQKLMEDALEGLEKNKETTLLDEFSQFSKNQYGIDISLEPSDNPDTFEKIFGMSFIEEFMREASPEELNAIQNHIDKISHKTDVNFWDELEKEKGKE